MKYRTLGKTGMKISEVSFGAWAIGGTDWGETDDEVSLKALRTAYDAGVNFYDTADVYGMGRSEKLIARFKKDIGGEIFVATKAGRKLNPHVGEGYNAKNIQGFIEESLRNLQTDSLDLLQLHCPPTEVYYYPELFDFLDGMKKDGKLKNYGVSVEKVEEALKAIEYPGVATVQIIFNMFRHRPSQLFFKEAKQKDVGIIVRVPLASGMLSGKMKKDSKFAETDHRHYNREGAAFDKGETFAGVDFAAGLEAVEELKGFKPEGMTMAQFALKWILMSPEVSCIIPGGKTEEQVNQNAGASDLPELSSDIMQKVEVLYNSRIRDSVHHLW